MKSWMSFSVALRVDSGTVLYSLGRRREDKDLEPNDRLANSIIDTTNNLELDMCWKKSCKTLQTSKSGDSGLQKKLSERQVVCSKQDAYGDDIRAYSADWILPLQEMSATSCAVKLLRHKTDTNIFVEAVLVSCSVASVSACICLLDLLRVWLYLWSVSMVQYVLAPCTSQDEPFCAVTVELLR